MKSDTQRTLLLTGSATLDEMLKKGNVWYVRNYEAYFDRVYVAYLFGPPHEPITQGNTTLLSLASGKGTAIDLLLVPYKLYRLVMKLRPTTCITMDLVFSWWTTCLIRFFVGITLMPVCRPDEIYGFTGRSLSNFLPIFLERVFTRLCFKSAHKVLTCLNFAGMFTFCRSVPGVRSKLIMVDVLPEALPSTGFVRKLRELKGKVRKQDNLLLYVGRLHREKLVDDLIRMMVYLKDTDVVLHIIGDGPERRSLEQLSHTLGVESSVKFLGMISNEDLPEHYLSARLFVSPYTGTSFREASMCGTQIIAYDTTAIEDKTGIVVVPLRDIEKLANAVRGFLGWER